MLRRGRVLKAERVELTLTPRTVGDTAGSGQGAPTPGSPDDDIQVSLRRNGDLVEAIEVVCPCGRHVEVECLYDPADMDPEPPESPS